MREVWTDERLDDLAQRMDAGFDRCEREFRALRLELQTEFAAVRSEMGTDFAAVRSEMGTDFAAVRSEMGTGFAAVRSEMGTGFAAVRSEMSATNRTMLQIVLGGYGLMIVGFAGTIATILTQA